MHDRTESLISIIHEYSLSLIIKAPRGNSEKKLLFNGFALATSSSQISTFRGKRANKREFAENYWGRWHHYQTKSPHSWTTGYFLEESKPLQNCCFSKNFKYYAI